MASEGFFKSGFVSTSMNGNSLFQLGMPCRSGVPQGSVLSLLLFLLCINGFNNSSNQLDFHLFAGDPNLFYARKSLLELERTVNNELFEVFSWL